MVSAIFKTETTALEVKVCALQSQLAVAQEQINLLNDAETLADGSLEALKDAISKVSALAPTAIATLRTAVLNLFKGDANDDGNGNQPIDPQPSPSPAPQHESLNGQTSEWASPLCSILEDAPSTSLQGQFVEIACIMSDAPKQPHIELIPVNHLVAYQRRGDGEIICCYLGGNNKNRLKDWGSWLCNQHSVGSGFELREAKRMTAFKWELKIWGMNLKQVMRLSETDTTKAVPSRYHVASMPVAENLLQTDEDAQEKVETAPELRAYQVGDRVPASRFRA